MIAKNEVCVDDAATASKLKKDILAVDSNIKVTVSKKQSQWCVKASLEQVDGLANRANASKQLQKLFDKAADKISYHNEGKSMLRKLVEQVIKEVEGAEPKVIQDIRDVLENGSKLIKDPISGKKVRVDSFSASAIIQVYDQIDPDQKEKYAKLSVVRMAQIAFKYAK